MAESKYTPERVNRILEAIEKGLPFVTAAALGGISEDTFYEWKKVHSEFSEAVKTSEAKAEETLVSAIQIDPSWQSKAWILERRHPDRWGRVDRNKVELTGKDGEQLSVKFEIVDGRTAGNISRVLSEQPE